MSCWRSPSQVKIAHFVEASSEIQPGPYDVSLVEGSITTAADAERIRQVREMSRTLVTIGACATAGGVQALRNFADVREFTSVVYARPEYISALATSTPIAAHVDVDFELHGCPIDRRQLLEVITALLIGRKPNIPAHSVCFECKQRGNVCVVVAHGTPCLGTGDARRMRCAVPGAPSRLLRLFRADGDTQRGRSGGTAAGHGHGRGRCPACIPHVQRRCARVHRTVPGHRRAAAGTRPARHRRKVTG